MYTALLYALFLGQKYALLFSSLAMVRACAFLKTRTKIIAYCPGGVLTAHRLILRDMNRSQCKKAVLLIVDNIKD